jgi:hypothetical protein
MEQFGTGLTFQAKSLTLHQNAWPLQGYGILCMFGVHGGLFSSSVGCSSIVGKLGTLKEEKVLEFVRSHEKKS